VRVPLARQERGAALLIALLTLVLLTAIATCLVAVSTTETLISAAHRHSQETLAAAEAALERALHDLAALPDWTPLVAPSPANLTAPYSGRQLTPAAPDGTRLDLARLASERQRDSDAHYGPQAFGADSPQWRLYAHMAFADLLPPALAAPLAYLIVWMADDGEDGDGNPAVDANGRLLVYAEAYGSGAARRGMEASVGRSGNGILQVLAWREVH
jgi:hypothetical protein